MSLKELLEFFNNKWYVNTNFIDCDENTAKYFSTFDDNNCMWDYYFHKTKEDAVSYAMNYLGCNETVADKVYIGKGRTGKDILMVKDNGFIEEYDGKLYYHGCYYSHTKYDELFDGDDGNYENYPKTKRELKTFLMDGNSLDLCWGSRSPLSCVVGNQFSLRRSVKYDTITDVRPLYMKDLSMCETYFENDLGQEYKGAYYEPDELECNELADIMFKDKILIL